MADVAVWARAHGFALTDWQADLLRRLYAARDEAGKETRFYVLHARRNGWTETRRVFAEIIQSYPG